VLRTPDIDRLATGFVYEEVELPLVAVLVAWRRAGICVDVGMLRTHQRRVRQGGDDARRSDPKGRRARVQVNSPQQASKRWLFEELGLSAVKEDKVRLLDRRRESRSHPRRAQDRAVDPALREVEKLRSTYGKPSSTRSSRRQDPREFRQNRGAHTGRPLFGEPESAQHPGAIPRRGAAALRLRGRVPGGSALRALQPDRNCASSRISAKDTGLLAAFASNEDVHRTIAGSVFGIAPKDVSHEQREQAKAVSYGLAYGMEAYGLSQRLGVTVSSAKEIMDQYFSGFPSLRAYMDATIKEIRNQGYSRTEFGRIRLSRPRHRVAPRRQAASARP